MKEQSPSFQRREGVQGRERRHQSSFEREWGEGREINPYSLTETNKHTLKSEQNIPRAANRVHADVWRQRSFCHVKAKRSEERIYVPQHNFSLCTAARSSCSHRQTPNALGKPGTSVLEHLRTECCLLTKNFLQHLVTDGDGLGLCDIFHAETGNAQCSPLASF